MIDVAGPLIVDGSVITDTLILGAPTVSENGQLVDDAGAYVLVGYVASSIGGAGSTISLQYGPTYFCASGSVAPNASFQSWATTTFNVDQPGTPTGATPAAEIPLDGSSLTLSFANYDGSPLMIQLIDSSFNYWCYDISTASSPVTIPLSRFNSQCWDDSGETFAPGTPIQAIQLTVSGSNLSTTAFSYCFLGLTIAAAPDDAAVDASSGGDAAVADASEEQ
jgi:hypothetical protein